IQSNMDSVAGTCLFPLHRSKTIHLVRHAQGIHNVEGDKNYKAYLNPEYFDAHLTPLGWEQVHNLRLGLGLGFELWYSSLSPEKDWGLNSGTPAYHLKR
ncbi:phosphoglycerate mutase-like protein, partial [Trifolium pratense]